MDIEFKYIVIGLVVIVSFGMFCNVWEDNGRREKEHEAHLERMEVLKRCHCDGDGGVP
jgi:hypothetical protein